jgi:hypothetical protein
MRMTTAYKFAWSAEFAIDALHPVFAREMK